MRTPEDKGEGGPKIGKVLRTPFMYDPLCVSYNLFCIVHIDYADSQ